MTDTFDHICEILEAMPKPMAHFMIRTPIIGWIIRDGIRAIREDYRRFEP